MTIDDKINDEKLQDDINGETAKISALSSGKVDKDQYVAGKEKLPFNQKQIIEQAKFAYSPLGKHFKKQTKTIEDQEEKQIKALEYHGKQLIESNELVKKDFNIDKDGISLEEQRKYLMNLPKKMLWILEFFKKANPNSLIYKYKTKGRSQKDFSNYQNLIELF